MAIPTYVGTGTGGSGVGAVTAGLPTGLQTDDILLCYMFTQNEAISFADAGGGTWTEVADSPQGTGTAGGPGATRLTVYWSRYNGTQTAPTTIDSGNLNWAKIFAFRGCATSGVPYDVTAGGVQASATTAVSVPGDTTTVADCLVLMSVTNAIDSSGGKMDAGFTNADLANIAALVNAGVGTGNGGGLNIDSGEKASAGAFGTSTGTLESASVQAFLVIALKPPISGYTLAAASGSYSVAGTTATLKANRVLGAASGTYSLTGTGAGLLSGKRLLAEAGSYSLVGDAVSFIRSFILEAASGVYGVSGTDVALLMDRRLSAEGGIYALVGQDAGLVYVPVGGYTLVAESGTYVLTGDAAGLLASRVLPAESGAYVIVGTDGGLLKGYRLDATPGVYQLVGQDAGFVRTYVLDADSGLYTLTGAPTLLLYSGEEAHVLYIPVYRRRRR